MLTELNAGDTCTAIMTTHLQTGENFEGAISIGHYADGQEVWIEVSGTRFHIQLSDVDTFCKQLKRAKALAVAASKEPTNG